MVASSPARPRFRDRAGWLLAGLALTVFLYSPLTRAMDPSLDASNYASYAYFTAHHFQYGTAVVPMYGPLGYVLPSTAYNGELYWARLLGQLACSAALAALVWWFFRRARPSPVRWLWLLLVVVLVPYIEDLPFELALLLGGLFLLEATAAGGVAAVSALLAVISLVKGTHLFLAVGAAGVAVAFHAIRRDGRRAALIAGAFLVTWLACWLAAGQSWRHVQDFLRGAVALVAGYNEAMALPETGGVFGRGLLALGALAGGITWTAWRARRQPVVPAAAVLFAGFTFTLWKHGFVRADGHVVIFHHYAALAAVLWFLFTQAGPAPVRVPGGRIWLALGVGCALWINNPILGPDYLWRVAGPWTAQHAQAAAAQLLHPARAKAALDAELAGQRDAFSLPLVREEVGDRPVDFFGLRHGVLLLNGLDYRPRPMGGGSFNAYNSYLMGLNRDFLRDARRRPPYYVLRLETIDGRFAAQDDGLALLELVQRYQPVRQEDGYLLLRATADRPAVEPVPLARQVFRFGETVTVPAVPPDRLLLARFSVPASASGQLRRFLYKLPPVQLVLPAGTGGPALRRRLVPDMAASPFLFSPLVEDNNDFLDLFTSQPGRVVGAFSLQTADPSAYATALAVEFFTLPRPAAARAPDVTELRAAIPDGLFATPPAAITAPESRPRQLGKLRVQQLHAPGRITWTLDGTEQALVFDHGLLPETFAPGRGNGVDFIVELHPAGAEPQVLFQRLVDPSAHPAERRTLTARIPLPPHLAGGTLVLRTDPGPHGDNAWDWSYVTRVQLKRQDPGAAFDRPPVALSGNLPALAEVEGAPVVLLHVPAAITLERRAAERGLHLEFGFLPGAYTGDGRTGGADFVVEWEAAGQPPREIFRRALRPVAEPADRGRQTATLDLPPADAAGRVVLRTLPVAGGTASWGWTYFSRVTFD
jgi:hypothetical protein